MGLSPTTLRAVRRKGYRLPTPIQRRALPLVLAGHDVVAMARTGSGKTAAFALPIVDRLGSHSTRAGARALIVSPSRELALQTHKVVRELARYTDLRVAALVGGDGLEAQFAELASNPDVLVATPGRLLHLLTEVKGLSLKTVTVVVFDEADRLFEMGFAAQLRQLLAALPPSRQALLFSATMPAALAEFAAAGLRDPEVVRLDADAALSPDLALAFFAVRTEERPAALVWLARTLVPQGAPTAIFCATRHAVEFVARLLAADGHAVAAVHGQMDMAARTIAIGRFRAGKARLLVVTDVAARGLDMPLLDAVINYDFPPAPKLFVHRAGRAARAGRAGTALSLADRGELAYVLDLHLFLSRPISLIPPGGIPAAPDGDNGDGDATRLGALPQAALDAEGERVREALAADADLDAAKRSTDNAGQLYRRTRPAAAAESAARARALPPPGVHPLAAAAATAAGAVGAPPGAPDVAAAAAATAAALRAWRPAATVLEADVAPARASLAGAHLPSTRPAPDAMRALRVAHGSTVAATRAEAATAAGDGARAALARARAEAATAAILGDGGAEPRFRDADFYVPNEAANKHAEAGYSVAGPAARGAGGAARLAAAVLDLAGDDGAGGAAAGGKRRYHWDAKKKRYVGLQADEGVQAGKRARVGGVAPKKGAPNAGATYAKWSKATRIAVAPTGGLETADAGRLAGADLAGRFQRGGRGWVNPASSRRPGGGGDGGGGGRQARDEVKSEDQMRADKRREAKTAARVAARGGGGARGGRGGGRGRGRGAAPPPSRSSSAAPGRPLKGAGKGAPRDFGKGGARAFGRASGGVSKPGRGGRSGRGGRR